MKNTMQSLKFNGNNVISYNTHVATIEGNTLKIYDFYSITTSKHLNQLAAERNLKKEMLTKNDNPTRKEQQERANKEAETMLKVTANFANIAAFFAPTQEEKNAIKKRILKAGINGIDFPDNFDQLPEDEKESRLNNAIKVVTEI